MEKKKSSRGVLSKNRGQGNDIGRLFNFNVIIANTGTFKNEQCKVP